MITAVVTVLVVVVALEAVLVAGLLRTHGEVLAAVDSLAGSSSLVARGAPPFAPLPDLVGVDPYGDVTVVSFGPARGIVLLAFLSESCLTCRPFWQALAAVPTDLPEHVDEVVVVTKDPSTEDAARVQALSNPRRTTVMSSRAWQDYGAAAAPYFAMLDAERGVVAGEGAASSWAHVLTMLDRWLPTSPSDHAATRTRGSTAERLEDVDEILRAAGIGPGHPSLGPR